MANHYLESTLLSACPALRDSWYAHRHTFDARDVREAGLDDARVAPYLGARTALVWSTAS